MTGLGGDLDDGAAFVDEEDDEAVAQVVWARPAEPDRLGEGFEDTPPPVAPIVVAPCATVAGWKDELVVASRGRGETPEIEIVLQRGGQRCRAKLPGLRRLDVAPAKGECLPGRRPA